MLLLSSLRYLLLPALLMTLSATSQDVSAMDHASLGIALARERKLPEAERELREAVRMAPGVASYRAQLASIFGLQEKWKLALESFQKAVDLAPENLDFRRETAAVEWQLGRMTAAEKNLQYVLTKHPGDSGALLLLGLVKERTGDYAKATQLLASQFELVSLQPDRAVALYHSSVESGQREETERVVEILKQHRNDRGWTDAIRRCTQMSAMAGNLQTAEELFALIPNDDPARPAAGLYVAKLRYDHAQVSEAKELLLQLAEQGVVSADLQLLLGNCFEAERRPDLAQQAYQRAIQIAPARIEYYEDLLSLLLLLHKTSEAAALVNHAVEVAPTDARPWVWKGNLELRRNFSKDALESYQRAAALDRRNPDAILGMATVYFVTGQSAEAIDKYKAGIARFPNDARFYVACAEMLLGSPDALKLHSQADILLEKAIQLAPQSAEAHYLLGQLALQQGRLQIAKEELSRSLQSDPDRSKVHFALAAVYRKMGRAEDATKEFALYRELKQREEAGTTSLMTTGKP